jgi:hypothetical protein
MLRLSKNMPVIQQLGLEVTQVAFGKDCSNSDTVYYILARESTATVSQSEYQERTQKAIDLFNAQAVSVYSYSGVLSDLPKEPEYHVKDDGVLQLKETATLEQAIQAISMCSIYYNTV